MGFSSLVISAFVLAVLLLSSLNVFVKRSVMSGVSIYR